MTSTSTAHATRSIRYLLSTSSPHLCKGVTSLGDDLDGLLEEHHTHCYPLTSPQCVATAAHLREGAVSLYES
jgi:hypothetical protein